MAAESEKPRSEDVELWLDRALRVRADIEPRVGLEDRVLARLLAEPQRKVLAWWQVLAAVATVLAIAAALVILQSGIQKSSKIVKVPQQQTAPSPARQTTVHAANVAPQLLSPHNHPALSSMPDEGIRRSVRRKPGSGMRESPPRLATFPAPRPESAEEHMLSRLAARRGSFDVANASTDLVPLKDLSVPELKIIPMEGTPPDNAPQE